MRFVLHIFATCLLVLLIQGTTSYSQTPTPLVPGELIPPIGPDQVQGAKTPAPWPVKASSVSLPTLGTAKATLQQKTLELQQAMAQVVQAGAKPDEALQQKIELLQKQIAVQQKMIQLLVEQVKKSSADGPAVEDLQGKVATLEARLKQGAQRDQDLAQAVDNLNEHIDSEARNGPRLPAALKELFLASRNNETPLSIYGSLLENYTQFNSKPGVFSTPDFAPYFLLQLNEQFLLAASIDINNAGVGVGEAQLDWLVTDWLTIVVGRYLDPIGFFNERLNHEWINRLPDVPLMFRQVSPLSSSDGLMLRGATYLCGSPVKLEYCLYGGNGLQAGSAPGSYSDVANLQNITGGPDETSLSRCKGGRRKI